MRKILLILTAFTIAIAPACKKDDDNNNNNNTGGGGGGGGGGGTPVDVWTAMGTYRGDGALGVEVLSNAAVIVTKISNTKIRVAPGAGNIMPSADIDVMTNDTAIFQPPGSQSTTGIIVEINAKLKPPTMLYSNVPEKISYFGTKQ